MKNILILTIICSTLLIASNAEEQSKKRAAQQLKIEMEKEKKYSKEQAFYQMNNYDFKGAEVNPDSVDSVPEIPVDDFDMDSVYD